MIDIFRHAAWTMRLSQQLAALVLSLLLCACGGKGGDNGSQQRNLSPNTFTVSGTVQVAPSTATDSDSNDTFITQRSNDSILLAQTIPNPVVVGGYVGQKGVDGAHFQSGDRKDFFSIALTNADTLTLIEESPCSVNFDLFLYDGESSFGQLIAVSRNISGNESIKAPADANGGRYVVEVRSSRGSGNYALRISSAQTPTSSGCQGSRFTPNSPAATNTSRSLLFASAGGELSEYDQFVPGDVIVKYKSATQLDHTLYSAQAIADSLSQQALSAEKVLSRSTALYKMDSNTRSTATQALIQQQSIVPFTQNFVLKTKLNTLQTIAALRNDPAVESAQPNFIYRRSVREPNDPLYSSQWHYVNINLPFAWELSEQYNHAADVIVAVIDSGILLDHPEFQAPNKLVDGYDFVSDVSISGDGDGQDNDPTDPGENGPGFKNFHGTHVAGTIGASTDNGIGVAGVAWNVQIMPLRALGVGGAGYSSDIVDAIQYATQTSSQVNPRSKAHIINMSLGGANFDPLLQQAILQARVNHGVIFVAAAGNQGSTLPDYPAALDGVISVAALDRLNNLASYSNFGSTIDVAAPGGSQLDLDNDGFPEGILSTNSTSRSNSYAYSVGTSMAAPHVAGVLALMKAANPNLTPAEVDSLLEDGVLTKDLPPIGRDNFSGYGAIDALKAVQAATQIFAQPLESRLVVSPSSVNLGDSLNVATLYALNVGSGTIELDGPPNVSQPWLSFTSPPANNGQAYPLGAYSFNVNRLNLADGPHEAIVTFSHSNGELVTVEFKLLVNRSTTVGDAGQIYVLLIDPEIDYSIDGPFPLSKTVTPRNGVYNFEFTEVVAGQYRIYAGNDLNNNQLVCSDTLEACGAYNTLSDPTLITIDENTSNLDFSIRYDLNVNSSRLRGSGLQLVK